MKVIWKAIVGEDIPAVVVFGLVFWTWPKFTVATVNGAAQKMGCIRAA